MSKEIAIEYWGMIEELRRCYSGVEGYLSDAINIIEELSEVIKPDDSRDYLRRLTGFMGHLASELELFTSSLAEGEPVELSSYIPAGLDPESIFFSDKK